MLWSIGIIIQCFVLTHAQFHTCEAIENLKIPNKILTLSIVVNDSVKPYEAINIAEVVSWSSQHCAQENKAWIYSPVAWRIQILLRNRTWNPQISCHASTKNHLNKNHLSKYTRDI